MSGTEKKILSALQLSELEAIGNRINRFGVNFAVCDTNGEIVLLCEAGKFRSSKMQLAEYAMLTLNQVDLESCSSVSGVTIQRFINKDHVLSVVLKSVCSGSNNREAVAIALIDLGNKESALPSNASSCTEQANPIQRECEYFVEILSLLAEKFQADTKTEGQIEKVSTELSQTYEELVLLHKLSTNMK